MRPDTRPIEFLVRRQASENSSCQTGGIHTCTAAIRPTDLEAPLCKVDRKDMHLCHLPFLHERHHGAGQASYSDAGRRGHPPHQFEQIAGSDGGGRTWATIATLLQTAKMNKVDPQGWLTQPLSASPTAGPAAISRHSCRELRGLNGLSLPLTMKTHIAYLILIGGNWRRWRQRCPLQEGYFDVLVETVEGHEPSAVRNTVEGCSILRPFGHQERQSSSCLPIPCFQPGIASIYA